MRTSLLLNSAALGLIAACSSDAVLPGPGSGATQATALRAPIRLVVVDSTQLSFAGTAAERAAGVFAFQIVGTAPTVAPGDYVAGRQGGLFLGRVVSVSQSADRLTLATVAAAWSEVYPPVKIHIPFAPGGGSVQTPYGVMRWGPWRMVTRPGQSSRITPRFQTISGSGAALVPSSDFTPFSFALDHFDLCAAAGVDVTITGCAHIAAEVLQAQFGLTGGVDLGVTFDPFKGKLDVFTNMNGQLNTTLDFKLTGKGSVELDVPIPGVGFTTAFTIAGLSGKLEVGVIIGVAGQIDSTTIEPHIQVSDTVTAGTSFSASNPTNPFTFQYTGAGHFDASAQVIDLGTLGVKLAVGPKFEVKLDIAGDSTFSVETDFDGFVEGTENLSGLLGLQNWHVHTDAGAEAVLGAHVNISLIAANFGGQETFSSPVLNLVDLWGTGDLYLSSSTTGSDIFPGQLYSTSVRRTNPAEAPAWSLVDPATLGVNDTHLFAGGFLCRQFFAGAPLIPPFIEAPQDCDIVATAHTVNPLSGIAWNCTDVQTSPGGITVHPRIDLLVGSRPTSLTLAVTCRSAYAIVRDSVAAMLATGRINVGGIATAFDAKLFAAEAARNAGDPAGADSALVDLMNQLHAQFGKHITTGAATELLAFDALLRACYETVVPQCSMVPAPASVALGARSP